MGRSVSSKGRKFLYGHEGVVLKAYRDAVGVLTIGAGLTAASGVITVKPGMTITAEENDRLVDLALQRNYVPRVVKALGESASQVAIDAGASFDYNTGKILSASWVKSFLAGNAADTRKRLGLWNKGSGKVLPGLTRRRSEEADILLLGRYPVNVETVVASTDAGLFAVFVISVTADEIAEIRNGFTTIGYDPGTVSGKINRAAVERFQAAYDLTVDGKIGRATLSTLQRELDARKKAANAVTTTVAASPVAAVGGEFGPSSIDPATIDLSGLPNHAGAWLLGAVIVAGAIYGAWLAWRYRDIVAARLVDRFPKLAAKLRSI